MICPSCGADDTKVIDSRASAGGAAIRRRRECNACGRRFTTYERAETNDRLVVVKKDGARAPFDAGKILQGVQAACGKRPIAEETKQRLVDEVETAIRKEFDREVSSREIGERVAESLRDVDEIAYVRFASEYYQFKDVSDILRQLADFADRVKDVKNQGKLFDEE